MRRALSNLDDVSEPRVLKLCEQGFAERRDNPWIGYFYRLTPRGQAALEAPRVTAAEYICLLTAEKLEGTRSVSVRWISPADQRVQELGWVTFGRLTKAGTTALNNVRAASGSADWKEN